jgi:Fur family peroxide stress response transcriptional regulator
MKYSKQRAIIEVATAGRYDHPTAATVYEDVRKQNPNISLGTVYRNLNLMADEGKIRKISMPDGADRFDGNPEPHDHLYCRKCGKVIDVKVHVSPRIIHKLRRETGMEIEGIEVIGRGVCGECQ